MLTQDDLAAIGELIDAKLALLKQDVKDIKSDMVTKSDLSANNRIFGTIVTVELASTKREIVEAVKAGFQEVVKHTKQKLDDHEDRIVTLEHEVFETR